MIIDEPVPFPGSHGEIIANLATHRFGSEDRCMECDCRPWGTIAEYPCGADVPRRLREVTL